MTKNWQKRRALKAVRVKLPAALYRDYEFSGPYSPAQVQSTAERCGIPKAVHPYAIAWLATLEGFERYRNETEYAVPSREELLEEFSSTIRGFNFVVSGSNVLLTRESKQISGIGFGSDIGDGGSGGGD